MTQPSKRPHYNVTFSVLLVGIAAFGLLQSLVAPVLPTPDPGLAHQPGHRDVAVVACDDLVTVRSFAL